MSRNLRTVLRTVNGRQPAVSCADGRRSATDTDTDTERPYGARRASKRASRCVLHVVWSPEDRKVAGRYARGRGHLDG